MRTDLTVALLALAGALPAQLPSALSSPTVSTVPEQVLVERGKSGWHLNFDFRISNPGASPALLDHLGVRVFDPAGALVMSKFVDRGGTAPGLDTVLPAPIPAGGTVHAFNPYHDFELEVDLARLEYELVFRNPATGRWLGRVRLTVEPLRYETRAVLHLPLQGRILVHDGHDFLSHHRRLGMDLDFIQELGVETNSGRYAYDFVLVDEQGQMFRGNGGRLENWYGWNAPILAPAEGTVVAVENEFPDNAMTPSGLARYDARVTPTDLNTFAGNYVVLDHGHGEFSIFGHLRRDSVAVEPGQQVKRGELLGHMGLSGATNRVHLHYQLQNGAHLWDSEGLPGPFHDYTLHLGSKSRRIERGQIDSGDIVEAASDR